MNNPGSIFVVGSNDECEIWLRTDWFGIELPDIVAEALDDAGDYLDSVFWDHGRAAYILFRHLTKGQDQPRAGFYIETAGPRGTMPVVTVDCIHRTVEVDNVTYTVADYLAWRRDVNTAHTATPPEDIPHMTDIPALPEDNRFDATASGLDALTRHVQDKLDQATAEGRIDLDAMIDAAADGPPIRRSRPSTAEDQRLISFVGRVRQRVEAAAEKMPHHTAWFNNLLARLGAAPLPVPDDGEWYVDVPVTGARLRFQVFGESSEAAYQAAHAEYVESEALAARRVQPMTWSATFEQAAFDAAEVTRLVGGLPAGLQAITIPAPEDLPTTREQAVQIVRDAVLEAMLELPGSPNWCGTGVAPHWRALQLGDMPRFDTYRFEFPAGPYTAVASGYGYDPASARRVAAYRLSNGIDGPTPGTDVRLLITAPRADLNLDTAPYTIEQDRKPLHGETVSG